MQPIRIYPQYSLVFTYNIRPGLLERYYSFITGEFMTAMQKRKLYIEEAWHITYGDAPERQIEFVTESMHHITNLLEDPAWDDLEQRLLSYTKDYQMRIIKYRKLKLLK
jgi:hypothetical protein